jgi:tetratricopeptide (TPR) repeat protein
MDWRGKGPLDYAMKNAAHPDGKQRYERCTQLLKQAGAKASSDAASHPTPQGGPSTQNATPATHQPSKSAPSAVDFGTSQRAPNTSNKASDGQRTQASAPQASNKGSTASSHASSRLPSKSAPKISNNALHAAAFQSRQSASLSKKSAMSRESEETLKNKGNVAFGQENYTKAADLYSQALQINENNHILYANRSAAYLALNQPTLAKLDAIKCISIDPKYVKGHFRLAQAHLALEDYDRYVS